MGLTGPQVVVWETSMGVWFLMFIEILSKKKRTLFSALKQTALSENQLLEFRGNCEISFLVFILMRGVADPCPLGKAADVCSVHTPSKKKNAFVLMETMASFFSCGVLGPVGLHYISI